MGKQHLFGGIILLFSILGGTGFCEPLDHWNLRTTNGFNSITFGGGKFVGVGNNGLMMESPDGMTWTPVASGTTNHLRDVAYGMVAGTQLFIAVGDNGAVTTGTVASAYNFTSITYGGGKFIAAATSAPTATNEPNIFIYKPFALPPTWQPVVMGIQFDPFVPTSHSFRLGYGNGKFIAVGNIVDGIWTSGTGTTWINQGQAGIEYYFGIAYGNGWFVTTGQEGPIRISSDGTNWTSTYGNYLTGISGQLAFGHGIFVASGCGNNILVSSNAVAWSSKVITNTSANFYAAAYGNGTFVVSSPQSGVGTFQSDHFKSSGLTNITRIPNGVNLDLAVEYGIPYTLETSPDLQNWTNLISFSSTNESQRISDTNVLSGGSRFYRTFAP